MFVSFVSTCGLANVSRLSCGVAWRGAGLPVPVPRSPWRLAAGPVTGLPDSFRRLLAGPQPKATTPASYRED